MSTVHGVVLHIRGTASLSRVSAFAVATGRTRVLFSYVGRKCLVKGIPGSRASFEAVSKGTRPRLVGAMIPPGKLTFLHPIGASLGDGVTLNISIFTTLVSLFTFLIALLTGLSGVVRG